MECKIDPSGCPTLLTLMVKDTRRFIRQEFGPMNDDMTRLYCFEVEISHLINISYLPLLLLLISIHPAIISADFSSKRHSLVN